jgi:hypothetical protein
MLFRRTLEQHASAGVETSDYIKTKNNLKLGGLE